MSSRMVLWALPLLSYISSVFTCSCRERYLRNRLEVMVSGKSTSSNISAFSEQYDHVSVYTVFKKIHSSVQLMFHTFLELLGELLQLCDAFRFVHRSADELTTLFRGIHAFQKGFQLDGCCY